MKSQKHLILPFLVIIFVTVVSVSGQDMKYERDRHRIMLERIKNEVKKSYYDPNLKGIDIGAKYKAADEKIKNATSVGQINGIIAQFLLDFDDSHLFFLPPGKANKTDYGFEMRMIGDKCFVVKLDKNSDAAKKGLEVGDEVYSLQGYGPTRQIFWKMAYYYYTLHPMQALKLTVIKPDGKQSDIDITAKLTMGKKLMDLTGEDINEVVRIDEDAYRKATRQYLRGFQDFLSGKCRVLASIPVRLTT